MTCKIASYNGVSKNGTPYTCVVLTLENGSQIKLFDNQLLVQVLSYELKSKK